MAHVKSQYLREAFEEYRRAYAPHEDFPTVIQDMIADLLHLGDALAEAGEDSEDEWDVDAALREAYGHWEAEVDDTSSYIAEETDNDDDH